MLRREVSKIENNTVCEPSWPFIVNIMGGRALALKVAVHSGKLVELFLCSSLSLSMLPKLS